MPLLVPGNHLGLVMGQPAAGRKARRERNKMSEENPQTAIPTADTQAHASLVPPDPIAAEEEDFDAQELREIEAMQAQNGFGPSSPERETRQAQVERPTQTPPPPPPEAPRPDAGQAAAGIEPAAATETPQKPRKASVLPKDDDPRATVRRLTNELRSRDGRHGRELEALKRQLEERDAKIRELESSFQSAKAAQADEDEGKEEEWTDEDLKKMFGEKVELNGSDFYRDVLQAAKIISRRNKGVSDKKVREIVDSAVRESREKYRYETVMDELEREMPGYRQLNEQARVNGFASYLDGKHPGTEFTRREVAERALSVVMNTAKSEKAHADAVSTIESVVRGFANPTPPAKPKSESPAPQNTGRPRFEKAKYVTPHLDSSTPPPSGDNGAQRLFTEAEVGAMREKAVAQGEGAYDRFEAWEMDLRRNGRVVQG